MTRLLIVDNYDSFTYNLAQGFARCGAEVEVVRNDADDADDALAVLDGFDALVISPGPGRPSRPADFGISGSLIEAATVPVLGVCLGHQGICELFGGEVGPAPEPYHGRGSLIYHDGDELFDGIASPFRAIRYHSLVVTRVPGVLKVIASCEPGLPMAVRHRTRPVWGVQFHPESIGTEDGQRLLENFAALAAPRSRPHPPPAPAKPAPPRPVPEPLPWRVLWRRVDTNVTPEVVFDAWYRRSPHAFWLDSSGGGRFSFLGDASGPLARVATASVPDGTVTVTGPEGTVTHTSGVFDWLRDDLLSHRAAPAGLPFGFSLGWVGYLGYELKAECGGAAKHRSPHPDAALIFADRAVAFDHAEGHVYLLALAPASAPHQAQAWLEAAAAQLTTLNRTLSTTHTPSTAPSAPQTPVNGTSTAPPTLRHPRTEYLNLINTCLDEIRAGESYEICLTNMVSVPGDLDPWPAYRDLRRQNPVPYGAYLRLAGLSVLSCSPERFLRIGADGTAESRPIKGTRPRSETPAADQALRDELAASEKDRAENLMIVDLLRNDLGRCAAPGSVTVPKLFEVETYASVHQLVSTVRARLEPGVHPVDCVRAAFPGGSMTGAPKIRTMEIIDALEGGPRGVYSGSIGYFSLTGDVDLSITIRTLIAVPGRVELGTGGAVIALSDPDAEFDETKVKAAPLLAFLGQRFPGG